MIKTIFTISLYCCIHSAAYADVLIGKVVGVTDGDTIKVLDLDNTLFKVRLAGIDAPEKKQPFGQASKKMLSDIVFGKVVEVDWHKRDRYDRLIGKVMIDGVDVNLEQIKNGLAWFYRQYQNELIPSDRLLYLDAENKAKEDNMGLWVYPEKVAPWDFRKRKKDKIN
jgi:endonuclease YncB( thermonuclease family)